MKKRMIWTIGALAAVLGLWACGAGSKDASYYEMSQESAAAAEESYNDSAYDTVFSYDAGEPEAMPQETAEEMGVDVSASSGIESVKAVRQKLIKTVNMSMETKEFDTLLSNVTAKTAELGGYVESSEVTGNGYYDGRNRRMAWLRLRIPADRLDGFIHIMDEMGNVTYKNESVQDVTLEYVDVESHKQALTVEQQRLMTLLEDAENMEDIIKIETRLSEIRYELQSYESRLRVMDNQVSYSTVMLDITEVERITEVEKKTFFEEIASRFSRNLYDIGQGARSFAIWFISSLPYLFIWAIVIGFIVWFLRRIFFSKEKIEKRRKQNREKRQEKKEGKGLFRKKEHLEETENPEHLE